MKRKLFCCFLLVFFTTILFGETADQYIDLANNYAQENDLEQALSILKQAVEEYPDSANVSLIIYNYLGQKIRTLVNEYQSTGNHSVIWDGTTNTGESVSSGIYLYQININNTSIYTKKMILF